MVVIITTDYSICHGPKYVPLEKIRPPNNTGEWRVGVAGGVASASDECSQLVGVVLGVASNRNCNMHTKNQLVGVV